MKSKKVLTILLALAIMVTFMPTMAFAAQGDVTWAKDYSTVTVEGYGTFNATRTFILGTETGETEAHAGMVKAVADTSDYSGTIPAASVDKMTTYYFELDSAQFAHQDHNAVSGTYQTTADWSNRGQVRGLLFTAPSYVTNKTATNKIYRSFASPAGAATDLNALGDWQGTVKYTLGGKDYAWADLNTLLAAATDDQKFDVSLDVSYNGSTTKTPVHGAVPAKNVTVKAPVKGTPANAQFYMDKVDTDKVPSTEVYYDGAEHTVVATPVKGYSKVEWEVYNTKTGDWDKKSSVTVKDYNGTNGISVRAKFYDDAAPTAAPVEVSVGAVKVLKNNAPKFQIQEDRPIVGTYEGVACDFAVTVGEEYDPINFFEVVESEATTAANYASAKKAVAANQTELLAYFKDYVKFETKNTKAAPDVDQISYKLNPDLSKAEKEALDKKYETLISNMNLAANGASITAGMVTVYRNPASTDYEVTFTKAIDSKTYKGKKLIKNGKLKKNQTIQFTAEAANGKAVIYKLIDVDTNKITIDSKTGKLTLKKGLKKGTYKFKVKAYVPAYGVSEAYEVQNVKIKVNKK
jgi:hypothetical protein